MVMDRIQTAMIIKELNGDSVNINLRSASLNLHYRHRGLNLLQLPYHHHPLLLNVTLIRSFIIVISIVIADFQSRWCHSL